MFSEQVQRGNIPIFPHDNIEPSTTGWMKQHLHQGGTTFLGSLVMMYSGQKVAGPNLKPLQPQGSILRFTRTKCSFLMSSPHRTPGPPRCSPCSWPQQSCLPKASPTSPHILLLLRPQLAVLQAFCPHSLPSHDPMLSLHFQTTFPSSVKDLFKDTGANFAAPSYSVALLFMAERTPSIPPADSDTNLHQRFSTAALTGIGAQFVWGAVVGIIGWGAPSLGSAH